MLPDWVAVSGLCLCQIILSIQKRNQSQMSSVQMANLSPIQVLTQFAEYLIMLNINLPDERTFISPE